MGIRCTTTGKELGAQSKSLLGDVKIRAKKNNDGWEVYSHSDNKILYSSPYKVNCNDYMAGMFDLFRLAASVPWRVE
jgi:hypothetical protein